MVDRSEPHGASALDRPIKSLSEWMALNAGNFREQFRIEPNELEAGMRAMLERVENVAQSSARAEGRAIVFDTFSALIAPGRPAEPEDAQSIRLTVELHMPWPDTSNEPMAFDDIRELAYLQRRSGYARSALSRAGEKHDPRPVDLTASRVATDSD